MRPSKEQVLALARMTVNTRPVELTCDEWLDRVSRYAELLVAGKPIPADLDLVAEHLRLCPECAEELEALKDALAEG